MLISYPEALKPGMNQHAYANSDRIMNSLISNGLQDYAGQVNRLKSFRKRMRKAAFEQSKIRLTQEEQRSHAWLESVVTEFNQRVGINSKANMFRACVFTQSRATGLGNNKMAATAVDKFLAEVTVKKEFNPDDTLLEAIEWVLDEVVSNMGGNPQFRISMSTSACTENPKKE